MDLKEAIDEAQVWIGSYKDDSSPLARRTCEASEQLVAAAKRDLARSEKEKPKRASLEELERLARLPTVTSIHQTADVLKALRAVVVPWLRIIGGNGGLIGRQIRSEALGILRALGEDP